MFKKERRRLVTQEDRMRKCSSQADSTSTWSHTPPVVCLQRRMWPSSPEDASVVPVTFHCSRATSLWTADAVARKPPQTRLNAAVLEVSCGGVWGGLPNFFGASSRQNRTAPPPNHQFEEKIQSLRERRSSWSQKNRARKHEAWLTSIHQPLEKTPLARPPP